MNNLILELVKVGFHGAAIAMAIFTYILLNKTLGTWGPKVDPKAGEILSQLLREIRVFMGVCIALFIVGVAAQLFAPQTNKPIAIIMVSPASWPKSIEKMEDLISVKHELNSLKMVDGETRINIDNKDTIRFIINDLVYEIDLLDRNYKTLLAHRSPLGGFGK